jgi:hypothetical protein
MASGSWTSARSAVVGGRCVAGSLRGSNCPERALSSLASRLPRLRGMKQMVGPRDISYEFFLVVRSTGTQRGRLVQQWRFPREAVTDRPSSDATPDFPQAVDGHLIFDEPAKAATVTLTGLVRPFEERIDLSRDLP